MVLNRYKSLKVVIALLPTLTSSMPISTLISSADAASPSSSLSTAQLYIYSVTSVCLVLLGGVFAGLTLGLMGQDEVYLKVIASSGTEKERKAANKLLELLDRGKHWLLVTLLLSNVITNETLPVILDRLLGGGFSAVFSSTVAIVIFGEIIPQSICVRYGLELGAFFAPYVLILMYLMYPVAYPIAKLLDYLLGEDHGTFYRKSGLKTLVNLHHTMGTERLNIDEVTIINSVLDLKVKPVSSIMTPIDKVYSLPSDKILDEKTVEEIFNAGYSRIPIHLPGEPLNFVGMLLVRILISYDPEDDLPISSFPLATLPETSLNTSCLNILNYFQEGKSHMVVVSETPGHDQGAKGVLTLEDVIEELIGEEIVDETDVYIDVDKNIKRKNPGPFAKRNVTSYLHRLYSSSNLNKTSSRSNSLPHDTKYISKESYKAQNHLAVPPLKPSNLAADPLKTTNSHITIKKQPTLSFSKWDAAHISQEDTTNTETSPLDLSNVDPDYGSNVENDEDHQVHSSEASALVQGIYENAERHLVKCNDPDECADDISRSMKSAKLSFLNNSYGIPVPKTIPLGNGSIKDDADSTFENSNGIFEDNIVSLKGVNKTIIHDKHYIETHI